MVSRIINPRVLEKPWQEVQLVGRRFNRYWKLYLFQGFLAVVALLFVLVVIDVVLQKALVVAIASSAFILFAAPRSEAANPRRVIGGHGVAVAVGTLLSVINLAPMMGEPLAASHVIRDFMAAVSVGVSFLIMALTKTEHPPAAGTALGLAIEWNPEAAVFLLLGAAILSVIHLTLRSRMRNIL